MNGGPKQAEFALIGLCENKRAHVVSLIANKVHRYFIFFSIL